MGMAKAQAIQTSLMGDEKKKPLHTLPAKLNDSIDAIRADTKKTWLNCGS